MSAYNLNTLFMALEDVAGEDTSGRQEQEVEHVFYGRIADPKALAALANQPYVEKCLQQQFQAKLDLGGNNSESSVVLRVRKVNKDQFVITRKTRTPDQKGNAEVTHEINEGLFNFLRESIGEGIYKMRYTIAPDSFNGKKLELDVFLDAQGAPLNGYAKYDYEVKSEQESLPPLPVPLLDMKHLDPFRCSDADAEQLKAWMKQMNVRYL